MENFDLLSINWDNEPRRLERAKVVAKEIINNISGLKELTAFEYGCGMGLLSFCLQPYLNKIILGDNSDGMLSLLEQKIQSNNITNMKPLKIDLSVDDLPKINSDIIYTLMTLHYIVGIDRVYLSIICYKTANFRERFREKHLNKW
jgi:hypothetical protein